MSLEDLNIQDEYRSSEGNIVKDFDIDTMEDLTMLRAFEIVTRDEATAAHFTTQPMVAVRAEDVSIEDWSGVWRI